MDLCEQCHSIRASNGFEIKCFPLLTTIGSIVLDPSWEVLERVDPHDTSSNVSLDRRKYFPMQNLTSSFLDTICRNVHCCWIERTWRILFTKRSDSELGTCLLKIHYFKTSNLMPQKRDHVLSSL